MISAAELQASEEIDNMSISEIIQLRFKKNVNVREVKTPQEVASVIIKGPEDANLEQNVEGEKEVQEDYQTKIADIETNRMYAWSDMPKVKKELWNKLHQVKSAMKEKVTNLAQTMVRQVQNSVGYIKDPIQHYYSKPSIYKQE